MSPEENKALVRRFYAEIDKGNIDAMDELVAEESAKEIVIRG
jgi:ketosteroid isomerase-like protein